MDNTEYVDNFKVGDFVCPKYDCINSDDECYEDLFGFIIETIPKNNVVVIEGIGRKKVSLVSTRKIVKTEIPEIYKNYFSKTTRTRKF